MIDLKKTSIENGLLSVSTIPSYKNDPHRIPFAAKLSNCFNFYSTFEFHN